MKGLVLAACVGSAAAVVAPQFPNAFYAVGGSCCCQDVRLHQMIGVTSTSQPSPTGTKWITTIGIAPSDFVIRDIVVSMPPQGTGTPGAVNPFPRDGRIFVNGQLLCTLATDIFISNYITYPSGQYYQSCRVAGQTTFTDGLLVPGGQSISVELLDHPATVMLAGTLR